MSDPFVSIITPTYNHARFVERCVRSVLEQSYPKWELIIVDDGSTDGTRQTAESLAAIDPRIEVIAHSDRRGAEGLADTYNEALAASRGGLVAVLEGDDWWAPDRLARQVPLLDDPAVVLAYGDCWEVSEAGRSIGYVAAPISSDSLRSSRAEAIHHFATLASVPSSTVLIGRDALWRVGGFRSEGLPLVDYPTWLRLSLQGDFVRVPKPLGYWRRHSGSVYWRNQGWITEGCHRVFLEFVEANGDAIRREGLDPERLTRQADEAQARMRSSLPYFDAKYELFCGDRSRAFRKFVRVVLDSQTSFRHRVAGLLGLGACLSSPKVFSVALAFLRSTVTPRAQREALIGSKEVRR